MKWTSYVLVGIAFLWVAGILAPQRTEPRFPHQLHERLFPACEGCHIGVLSGVEDEVFPDPDTCARCHDGTRAKHVAWSPPSPRASTLRFFHPDHRKAVVDAGEADACRMCHAASGAPSRMNVGAALPSLCLQCHTHRADAHLAETAECGRCHVPLAEAVALTVERIARFPRPASHGAADFLTSHVPAAPIGQASCSVCHARDTCARCHANADHLPQVAMLARDERVAVLERGRPPEYPVPASHRTGDWTLTHGQAALTGPVSCGNCHTRPGCMSCHLEVDGSTAAAVASLPPPGEAPGVSLDRSVTLVHPSDFLRRHGSSAATGALQCSHCHSQSTCASCHAGADSRTFHPLNFLERHSADVFAGAADCQSCHSTEVFCRACHVSTGLASRGRMTAAFHTAQPLWILSHGRAARMGMDACASCHRQSDCVQCHSAAGGWGVNPHGPGFPASRMAARNQSVCRACHMNDPLGRN
jgi:predicted CXXCH cytochrome family protein